MITTLLALSLHLNAAMIKVEAIPAEPELTLREKMAATEPLVRSATSCIVRAVTTDPRYVEKQMPLGDLIVASMPTCVAPMRAMIDAYDHYYGDGTGEAFFMGPYLDVLPKAIVEGAKKTP